MRRAAPSCIQSALHERHRVLQAAEARVLQLHEALALQRSGGRKDALNQSI